MSYSSCIHVSLCLTSLSFCLYEIFMWQGFGRLTVSSLWVCSCLSLCLYLCQLESTVWPSTASRDGFTLLELSPCVCACVCVCMDIQLADCIIARKIELGIAWCGCQSITFWGEWVYSIHICLGERTSFFLFFLNSPHFIPYFFQISLLRWSGLSK